MRTHTRIYPLPVRIPLPRTHAKKTNTSKTSTIRGMIYPEQVSCGVREFAREGDKYEYIHL